MSKLRELTWSERGLLLQAMALLPMIALGLRLFGFNRVQSIMARLAGSTVPTASNDRTFIHSRRLARIVSAAARYGPYRANCLPTSLALKWYLTRHGIRTDLRIGVRKTNGLFEAHAWVEHQAEPLIHSDKNVHTRFAAFEQAHALLGVESP